MSDDGDKKFDATPQRREQYQKQGRFARARDAGPIAATAAVLGTLMGARTTMAHAVALLFARCHGDLGALGRNDGHGVMATAAGVLVAMAAPPVLAATVASIAAGVAQTGGRVNTESMGFQPDRLNPLPRIKQLFSWKHAAIETGISVLRVGVVAWVAWRTLQLELPALLMLGRVPVDAAIGKVADASGRVVLSALGALLVIAVVDYAQSRYVLEQEMKMSRQELMEENRSQEGDAKSKHKARARARAAIRKKSLASVKTADVVVTNPTHIAVALRYAPGDPCPVVVAKGHDDLALQIRALARRQGIPILENRPLARALDAAVPLGKPVPAKHFAAVARVLAYVYRLRRRQGVRDVAPSSARAATTAPASTP